MNIIYEFHSLDSQPGLANTLEIRLHEAVTTGLTHRELLEFLLQDELLLRNDCLISRRDAMAGFRDDMGIKQLPKRSGEYFFMQRN